MTKRRDRLFHRLIPAIQDNCQSAIPIPVARNDKRASRIACVLANCRALKPVIVIPRKTIEIDVYECGFTRDTCHVVVQEHGFLIAELCAEWAEAVFFTGVIQTRRSRAYGGLIFSFSMALQVMLQI
jgi:hypothetical protein